MVATLGVPVAEVVRILADDRKSYVPPVNITSAAEARGMVEEVAECQNPALVSNWCSGC